ncbi:MAG: methionine adenosyltransferase [Myxococcales bacterium]|jgi:S-adenosylmethionine synthetase
MNDKHWFTSESVAEGHPDKVADRISDEILDACLATNPEARVAIETLVTDGLCVIAGEVRGAWPDYEACARRAIRDIGYRSGRFSDQVPIQIHVHEQSKEIALGVDATEHKEEGAGDQGVMFGFACDETPELMPAAVHYAHRIVEAIAKERHAGEHRLGPDGKSQVTIEYDGARPVRADAVVVSQMHDASMSREELSALVLPIVKRVLPAGWFDERTRFYLNPAGTFVEGGPAVDTGVTGRKIVVDTYGGAAPHGGGAFSGKDPTKVDRSAAYAARHLAKNVVAAGLASRCLIQVSYAIGVSEPISLRVDCQGTGRIPDTQLAAALCRIAPMAPRKIRERLGLNRPIYARTAAYGHFGRAPEPDGGFSWERLDLVEELKRLG